jgi:hypothetical protein
MSTWLMPWRAGKWGWHTASRAQACISGDLALLMAALAQIIGAGVHNDSSLHMSAPIHVDFREWNK